MELLIVILIIGLLAGMMLAALAGAVEQARESRTRSIVNKLDQLIMAKYESYRTRRLPIRLTGIRPASEDFTDGNGNGFWDSGESFVDSPPFNSSYDRGAAYARLMAMRELMRMELPDRVTDVVELSTGNMEVTFTGMSQPSLQRTYYRTMMTATSNTPASWSPANQGSECLYLIVSAMKDGDKNALDFFSEDEIGDTDGDNMPEILDGWGEPIGFLRWAPAFTREQPGDDGRWGDAGVDDNGNMVTDELAEWLASGSDDIELTTTEQSRNSESAPDPFDPVREDARATFALRPLIVSGGRDGVIDIAMDFGTTNFRYSQNRNDPYYAPASPLASLGTINIGGNGEWLDNITNHWQEPQ